MRLGRWKSSVAHCRGSQRPQRRTCESAVIGIMQNYGPESRVRERHAGEYLRAIESVGSDAGMREKGARREESS